MKAKFLFVTLLTSFLQAYALPPCNPNWWYTDEDFCGYSYCPFAESHNCNTEANIIGSYESGATPGQPTQFAAPVVRPPFLPPRPPGGGGGGGGGSMCCEDTGGGPTGG